MKTLIKLAILIILALMVAMLSMSGPGHVIIFIRSYRVDISLTALIIIISVIFASLYYLIRLWVNLNRLPNKIRKWRAKHALLQSRNYLNSAGIHYFEGKYGNAYKNALNSLSKEVNKDNRFLALMLAYKCLSYMRNYEKGEEVLQELDSYTDKKWQLAKFMVSAENQYAEQKYGLCLDNLKQVLNLDKRHIPARRIMLKVYLRLNNYEKAFEVLNWLIKHDYLENVQAQSYKLRVLSGLFEQISDVAEVYHFYRKLDKQDQDNDLINKFYFDSLIRLKQYLAAINLAASIGVEKLNLGIIDSFIILAKKIDNEAEAKKFLLVCENYLASNRQNWQLLLALGIISFTLQLWAKARSYIEASIALKPTIDGYLYLSFIAKAMDNQQLQLEAERILVENIHKLV